MSPGIRLSRRTAWPQRSAPWHDAASRTRRGKDAIDLTISNPTAVGLVHPPGTFEPLGRPGVERYAPHPFGIPSARHALARHFADRGVVVNPERFWIVASTSEAYVHLLTLLCDPGDAVAIPRPGYPLLDHLADMMSVRKVGYPLAYDGAWHIDRASLQRLLASDPRIRAVVLVSPNNPTSSCTTPQELRWLTECCAAHGAMLLVDQVFADYVVSGALAHISPEQPCLTAVLSGLSKVAALPQLKLSWLAVGGPPADLEALWSRAEIVADTLLSANGPVQLALPELLAAATPMQQAIVARIKTNLACARAQTASTPLSVLPFDGGWTALLRLPTVAEFDDEAWALELCERAGVVVQPGYLYDLHAPLCVAVSLITEPRRFESGLQRVVGAVLDRVE